MVKKIEFSAFRRPFVLVVVVILLLGFLCCMTACGGGGGSTSHPKPDPPNPDPPADVDPLSLSVNFKEGDYLEYVWEYESIYHDVDGDDRTENMGFFRLTFGASTTIDGKQAIPLSISGDAGEFKPRWTHIAFDGGDLFGSTDGTNMQIIYSSTQKTWTGGGFFKVLGETDLEAKKTTFKGSVNTIKDCVGIKKSNSSGGCESFSDIGLGTICSDESEESSWAEYYKNELGPIGYYSYYYADKRTIGEASYWSKTTQKVELIETSLSPTDGTEIATLPWKKISDITDRKAGYFSCAAFKGKLYLVGGNDAPEGGAAIPFTEIYDPKTEKMQEGPSAPEGADTMTGSLAEWGDKLYFISDKAKILSLGQNDQQWISEHDIDMAWPSVKTTTGKDGIYVVIGGKEKVLVVDIVDPDKGHISKVIRQKNIERFNFAVASLDDDIFLLGGSSFKKFGNIQEDSYYDEAFRLDAASGTWTDLPPIPTEEPNVDDSFPGRQWAAATVADGKIIVIGGRGQIAYNDDEKRRSVVQYDPKSDSWSKLEPFIVKTMGGCACELDGSIYYFCPQTNALWRWDPIN